MTAPEDDRAPITDLSAYITPPLSPEDVAAMLKRIGAKPAEITLEGYWNPVAEWWPLVGPDDRP